jgi:hypothetical protein
MKQNDWVEDARETGIWNNAEYLAQYLGDCKSDLTIGMLRLMPAAHAELTTAIELITQRIKEINQ